MGRLIVVLAVLFVLLMGCGGSSYQPVNNQEQMMLQHKSCDFCGKPIVIPKEPAPDPTTPLSWYHIEKYVQGARHPLVGDVCSTGCAIKWIEKHREEV